MSAPDPIPQHLTTGLAVRIVAFLKAHPGETFRARDVAHAIGIPPETPIRDWTKKVGQALSDYARRGSKGVYRIETTPPGWTVPCGRYGYDPDRDPKVVKARAKATEAAQ